MGNQGQRDFISRNACVLAPTIQTDLPLDEALIANSIEFGNITINGTTIKISGSGKYASTKENGRLTLESRVAGVWVDTQTTPFSFPFPDIPSRKLIKLEHVLSESGRTVRFNYSLSKTPKYQIALC